MTPPRTRLGGPGVPKHSRSNLVRAINSGTLRAAKLREAVLKLEGDAEAWEKTAKAFEDRLREALSAKERAEATIQAWKESAAKDAEQYVKMHDRLMKERDALKADLSVEREKAATYFDAAQREHLTKRRAAKAESDLARLTEAYEAIRGKWPGSESIKKNDGSPEFAAWWRAYDDLLGAFRALSASGPEPKRELCDCWQTAQFNHYRDWHDGVNWNNEKHPYSKEAPKPPAAPKCEGHAVRFRGEDGFLWHLGDPADCKGGGRE